MLFFIFNLYIIGIIFYIIGYSGMIYIILRRYYYTLNENVMIGIAIERIVKYRKKLRSISLNELQTERIDKDIRSINYFSSFTSTTFFLEDEKYIFKTFQYNRRYLLRYLILTQKKDFNFISKYFTDVAVSLKNDNFSDFIKAYYELSKRYRNMPDYLTQLDSEWKRAIPIKIPFWDRNRDWISVIGYTIAAVITVYVPSLIH